MIRHIVFFSARDPADIDRIVTALYRLGEIGTSEVFEVARNLANDPIGNEVDIVVYAEFAGEAELAAYRTHPIYVETTRIVRPLREMRLSADVAQLEFQTLMSG